MLQKNATRPHHPVISVFDCCARPIARPHDRQKVASLRCMRNITIMPVARRKTTGSAGTAPHCWQRPGSNCAVGDRIASGD